MATTRQRRSESTDTETTETAVAVTNGGPVRRSVSDTGIPKLVRQGRKRNTYPEWAEEIAFLKANPGTATSYDADDCHNLANGLRRTYGVKASCQNVVKADAIPDGADTDEDGHKAGFGVMWLTFATKRDESGNTVLDEEAVADTIAKYAK